MDIPVDNNYVKLAIEDLRRLVGIRLPVDPRPLRKLLRRGKLGECVQEIATTMGLPVRIELQLVPEGIGHDVDGSRPRFHSSRLVANKPGAGIAGITAEVSLPTSLPLFGTSALSDFPITVRVNENCRKYPNSFISVIGHEMAHILLRSLCSPDAENEVYADVTPLLLGFVDIAVDGRSVQVSSGWTTSTMRYGYLADSQFAFATRTIRSVIEDVLQLQTAVTRNTVRADRLASSVAKGLPTRERMFRWVSAHPRDWISPRKARRLVAMHVPGYVGGFRISVAALHARLARFQTLSEEREHLADGYIEELTTADKELETVITALRDLRRTVRSETVLLKRCLTLRERVRRLWQDA